MSRPYYSTYPISMADDRKNVWCITRNGKEIAFGLDGEEARELVRNINNDLNNLMLQEKKESSVWGWFFKPSVA